MGTRQAIPWAASLALAMGPGTASAAGAVDQLRIEVNGVPQTAALGPLTDTFSGVDNRHQPLGSVSWTNSAVADYGTLGASTQLADSYALSETTSTFAQTGWQASYAFHSPTGADVPISMNLVLDGSMFFDNGCGSGHAGCELTLTLDAGFLGVGGLVADNGALLRSNGMVAPVASQFRYDGSRFTVPITTNIGFVRGGGQTSLVSLTLTVSSLVAVSGGSASTKADFFNTLSFPTGGIAFNLPEGVTVTGPGLIDNCFGGAEVCSVSAVPEPTRALLLGAGVLGLLGWRRHRAARQLRRGR